MSPKYLAKKILFYIGSFWVILFINFLIPRLMPGNPVIGIIGQLSQYHSISPSEVKSLYQVFGSPHTPIYTQFFSFVGEVFRGNFGVSIDFYPHSVLYVVSQSITWTIFLFGIALVGSFFMGNYLGSKSALARSSLGDKSGSVVTLFLYSFPYFWLALMLQVVFALYYPVFPALNAYNALKYIPGFNLGFIMSVLKHLMLPLLTLLLTSYGGWYLGMRNNMLITLNDDYLRYGKMIGMKNEILLKYARRNAMIPNLTAFALAIGGIIGAGVLVDIVFSYPGLGFTLYQAIVGEDYPVIQTVFLFIIIGVLIANFFMDLLYAHLDPRITEE